jgi:hypothetical protein
MEVVVILVSAPSHGGDRGSKPLGTANTYEFMIHLVDRLGGPFVFIASHQFFSKTSFPTSLPFCQSAILVVSLLPHSSLHSMSSTG